MSTPPKPDNSATTGRDSLGKALRRNASARRWGLLWRRAVHTLRTRGAQALWREVAFRLNLALHRPVWRYRADIPLRRELRCQRKHPPNPGPLVSVVVPVYNTPPAFFSQMVKSIQKQSYPNWELLLADASDEGAPASAAAAEYQKKDARIHHLRLLENGGIAANTNQGLSHSRGEWIVLLDHDDVLQPNALYEVVSCAAETGAEMIYSDEIVLDKDLKQLGEYHFKGDFAPDTLRGCNYITHLCAFSAALLARAGGAQHSEYDGAQDYDLILRLTEQARGIHHLPKVLYFWRRHAGSTASEIAQKPAAVTAGQRAIQAQLDRLGMAGFADIQDEHPGAYRVRYEIAGTPMVSVLIPSSDHTEDLQRCLQSLYQKGGWRNFEVLVLDNNSHKEETQQYYRQAQKQYPGLRIVHYPGPFNFSAINNFGAKLAKGEHLLLLNNDVELIGNTFLRELLAYSQRADVGAVGAMLYYPDSTVQHAGLIVGIGGTAGVSHKGHARGDGGDMFRLCTTQNVSAVTGAALMVKKSLYHRLGGLDEEQFAVAFNDVDFCLRLREEGLWNVFTPFAQAWHYESKSRGYDTEGEKKQRFDKEKAAFQQRWAALLAQGDPFYNPHFTLKYENFGYR